MINRIGVVLAALVFVWSANTIAAQQVVTGTKHDIDVLVTAPLAPVPLGAGVTPVIFQLKNIGEERKSVEVNAKTYRSSAAGTQFVTLEPGESARIEIPLHLNVYNNSFQITARTEGKLITSGSISQQFKDIHHSRRYRGSRSKISAAFVTRDGSYQRYTSSSMSRSGSRVVGDWETNVQSISVRDVPHRWQSLVGVDVLLFTPDAWQEINADQILAVKFYVEQGGVLILRGFPGNPSGEIVKRFPNSKNTQRDDMRTLGFGFVAALTEKQLELDSHSDWMTVLANSPLKDETSITANGRFEFVDVLRFNQAISVFGQVKAQGFAVTIFFFALIVGPINFFILSRKKKKVWALWTIPLISIVAFLSLIGYSLLTEGVDTKVFSRSVIYLDQEAERAHCMDSQALYATFAPGDLNFPGDTSVSELAKPNDWYYYYDRGNENKTADWGDGLTLSAAWFPARTPTQILVTYSEPFRRKLEFSRDEKGNLTVINGFNVDLIGLLYCDQNGNLFSVERVSEGGSAPLQPNVITAANYVIEHVDADVLASWPRTRQGYFEELKPNSYLAISRRNPLPRYGNDDMQVLDGASLIFGTLGSGK